MLEKAKKNARDEWKDAHWVLYRRRKKAKKDKADKERKGIVVLEEGCVRRRLTPEAAKKYDKRIRKNFRREFGEDGFWSYQFLGECYIHGMMDGEAMLYLNGTDKEDPIPTTIFEIR